MRMPFSHKDPLRRVFEALRAEFPILVPMRRGVWIGTLAWVEKQRDGKLVLRIMEGTEQKFRLKVAGILAEAGVAFSLGRYFMEV